MPTSLLENQRLEREKIFKKLTRRARRLVQKTKDVNDVLKANTKNSGFKATKSSAEDYSARGNNNISTIPPPKQGLLYADIGSGGFISRVLPLTTPLLPAVHPSGFCATLQRPGIAESRYEMERVFASYIGCGFFDRTSTDRLVCHTPHQALFQNLNQNSLLSACPLGAACSGKFVISNAGWLSIC